MFLSVALDNGGTAGDTGGMRRTDRLFAILHALRDGRLHRAEDIAARLGVSVRTIYRDMDILVASGIPVEGARGSGYRLAEVVALPPMTLTPAEAGALTLAIAIVAEAADPDLQAAARTLADKIDAALPAEPATGADAWKFAASPFADNARGLSHIATLRAAIRGRQKLRLDCRFGDGGLGRDVCRPLHLDHIGRVWALTVWSETEADFRVFRLDLIEEAEALPELFVDEPGKRHADYLAARTG